MPEIRVAQVFGAGGWKFTRCVVRYALPLLQCIESGSFPGYEFGVVSSSVVRGGDVNRTCSPGKRTKPVALSSITQLECNVMISN